MDRRVLIVGETTSFIVNAITTGLEESGFECVFAAFDLTEISQIEDKPALILLYLDEQATTKADVLVYIRDI